jgi:hypothetical protein
MNKSGIMVGILSIMVVVVVSGCTSTSSTQKTYSDGNISFNYPSNYVNANNPENITSKISNWQDLAYLKNQNNIEITVSKNPKADSATSERDNEQNSVRANPNNTILVTTTKTNPNGIVVEIGMHKVLWPNSIVLLRYYDMYFSSNGVVYLIYVNGSVDRTQEIMETGDSILNTLKIS